MDDEGYKGLPLSFRDRIVLGQALRDESESQESDPISDLTLGQESEIFTLETNPENLTLCPIKDSKRPRLDGTSTSQRLQELPLHPGNSQSVSFTEEPTFIETGKLPMPDVNMMPQAQSILHLSVTSQTESEQEELKELKPAQLHTDYLETDIDACFSDSLPTPILPSLSHESPLIALSPLCPSADDCESSFGPDYFWDYCSEDDTSVPTPMDLSDVYDSQEGPESTEDDSSNDTSNSTSATEEKEVPLYQGAPINQWESLTSILSFVTSEHLSGAGLGRLLSLIDLHLPKRNNFLKSKARLWNMLEDLDEPVHIHYFCSVCYKIRKNSKNICDTCTDGSRCVLFFITFPLVPQLKRMFARPGFKENLSYKEKRSKKNIDNIEDIYDGQNYKEAEKNFNDFCINITFMFNTDGMQIFNSNTFSLWPFYLVINELAPNKRFLSENLLIAGLWGSVVKPHPNIFLLPIYKDIKLLETGIDVNCYGGEGCNVVGTVISGTCDAPACACFMNLKQHSGFYSCPVCLIKGEKPGDSTVFPYEENNILRKIPQYEEHKRWAVEKRVILSKTVRNEDKWCGVKGPTILSDIVPNMFNAMSIDSMHCVYLGVMRQILNLLIDKDYKDRPFSIISKLKIVNERLRDISSPHFLQRSTETLDKLVHWKASQLRSFMFTLALVILRDILKPEYYNHLSYFVNGVALLNSSSISEENLVLASLLLDQFVSQFSSLYGPENMSHNLHKVLHLERCVRLHGPLWCSSCFPFEDMNGRLSNLIHGTRHVGLQIHTNLSVITKLPLMVQNLKDGGAKDFCTNILRKRSKIKITEKISPGVYCVGVLKDISNNLTWVKDVLAREELLSQSSVLQLFGRLLINKLLYVSNFYQRGKRVSSYVKYVKNDCVLYGNIECFLRLSCACSGDCSCGVQHFAVIRRKPVSVFEIQGVVVTHMFMHQCNDNCQDKNNSDVVNVSYLSTVMFKIDGVNEVFLCEPLNQFELE